MPAWLGFRQRPLHPFVRRLRFRMLGWLSNRPPNSKRIYLVTIGDRRYKRVVFSDSHQAEIAAARLEAFGPTRIYPALVLQRERELWVEYVEGEPLRRADPEVVGQLAGLFSVLYRRAPRCEPIEATPFAWALHRDLRFLRDVGVIPPGLHGQLDEVAGKLAPKQVWVGYDCTDAILKNFVRDREGRIRAIDVESLGAGQLLGSGAAKAAVRWLGPLRDAFLVKRLREAGAVILGKTNLSEWANFRSYRSTSGWSGRGGLTRNPYVLDRNTSGSSSGSGAAVAANFCAVAVGTETDGSIISPSTYCGLVGLSAGYVRRKAG